MHKQIQVAEPVVSCPECGHQFPLSKALAAPIEAQVAQRLEAKFEERERLRKEEVEQRVAQAKLVSMMMSPALVLSAQEECCRVPSQ